MMEKITVKIPGDGNFAVEEAYKTLRTNIRFCGMDIKVIGFTSYGENEGKSTICLGVGKSFSELGKRCLWSMRICASRSWRGATATLKTCRGFPRC